MRELPVNEVPGKEAVKGTGYRVDGMLLSCNFLITLVLSLGTVTIAGDTVAIATADSTAETTQAQTHFDQGLIAYRSGQLREAIQHWQQALALYDTSQQQAQTLGNLAIAYYETGQYFSALEANQTALDLFTALEQVEAIGQVHGNLGNIYEALGDYDRAIESYQASLRVARGTENQIAEGVTMGNLGYLYSVQGEQATALATYEQSLAIAREMGDREGESHRLLNIGIAHHALEEIATAAQFYQSSLEVARDISHRSLEARALGNLGMVAADRGHHDEAIAYYEQSLAIAKTLQNPELTARTLNNLGHTLLAANRLEVAEARLREAIAQLDRLRSGLADAHNISVFDTQIYTYNLLTQILVAQNQPEAALEMAEAGRAQALTELLTNRLSPDQEDMPVGNITASPLSLAQIRATAQQANATLVEYSLVPEDTFRVQGKQRGRTAEIHIWVVQPDGTIEFRHASMAGQSLRLTELVQASRDVIGVRGRGGLGAVQANDSDRINILENLHQLLIDPIQDLLPHNPEDRVVFIPQGDLFLVPFPALLNAEGDHLIQHHTILTAPSIQVLRLTQQRREHLQTSRSPDQSELLVVGNPNMPEVWHPDLAAMQQLPSLPGAEQEALAVATMFDLEALVGQAAAEALVKQRMETAHIVHLATHGLLEYGNPQNSGIRDIPGAIALTPAAGEDGLLTSAEILGELTLKADLVVLSACDTGRGDITGDGVIGLSRSLMAAGTPSVIVSLWSVPDAPTADLMVQFYAELKQGQDKAQALRQAMLATMQDHPDPKNWAAFTLIGAAQW